MLLNFSINKKRFSFKLNLVLIQTIDVHKVTLECFMAVIKALDPLKHINFDVHKSNDKLACL